jgi:hypothetical protein
MRKMKCAREPELFHAGPILCHCLLQYILSITYRREIRLALSSVDSFAIRLHYNTDNLSIFWNRGST